MQILILSAESDRRLDGLEEQVAEREEKSKALKTEYEELKESFRVLKKWSKAREEDSTQGKKLLAERIDITDEELTHWFLRGDLTGEPARDALRDRWDDKKKGSLMLELYGVDHHDIIEMGKYWSLLQMFAY